jgi:hypothetical protein
MFIRLLLLAIFLTGCLPAPPPMDADGDGFEFTDDCNDTDPSIHPNADELCDGIDNDCDGEVDNDALDAPTWYLDADDDGFGDPESMLRACLQPSNHVSNNTDCDDTDPHVNPDAEELCDGIDNDCDGEVDNGIEIPVWYYDGDNDGYGDPTNPTVACVAPAAHVATNTDCDDTNPDVNPGAEEVLCRDGVDQDCDGVDGGPIAFGDLRFGDLVLTEVMAAPTSSPQWFELWNGSECTIDVEPFYLENAYGGERQLVEGCSASAPSGGYLTVSSAESDDFDCSFSVSATTISAYDSLKITTADGEFLDSIFWEEIEAGHSWSLDLEAYDPTANNNISNWCWETEHVYSPEDFGTPGENNNSCP